MGSSDGARVPEWLRTGAAWGWRLLVLVALGLVLLRFLARIEVLVVALFVAMLISALVQPGVAALRRWGFPRILATLVVLVGAFGALVGMVFLVVRAVVGQADELSAAVTSGMQQAADWLSNTLGLDSSELFREAGRLLESPQGGQGIAQLPAVAFGAASTVFGMVAGAGITLLATVFFVHDGAGIWRRLTSSLPRGAAFHVRAAGPLAWQALASYARGTVIVAAIDGVGIGVGVALVGVPLALPIGVLVFLSSFVPLVGAFLSGLVAVLVALASQGLGSALAVLAIVLGVQQVEAHLLQPLVQGRMVSMHPLAIVAAITIGSLMAGILGAVIAVPVLAMVRAVWAYARAAATAMPATAEAEAAVGVASAGAGAGAGEPPLEPAPARADM